MIKDFIIFSFAFSFHQKDKFKNKNSLKKSFWRFELPKVKSGKKKGKI